MRFPIRWKLLLAVTLPIVLVYVVMIVGVLTHLERRAQQGLQLRMTETARRCATEFDGRLRELAQVARATAAYLETGPWPDVPQLYAQLGRNVAGSPLCYGAATAFAPGAYAERVERLAPYAYRRDGEIRSMDVAADAYDYTDPQWAWYRQPRETGEAGWTEPYFDEGAGNVLMSTYSVPFFREEVFAGVTTVDVAIEPLRQAIVETLPREVEFFVITPTGRYVYHAEADLIMESTIFARAETQERPDLARLGEAMVAGESGVRTLESPDGAEWVVYAAIPSPGWSLAARISEEEALAPVRSEVMWLALVLGGTMLLIALSIWMASGWITRPLLRLTGAVREVAAGNLDAEAPDGDRVDEVGELSRSFNQMRSDLNNLIARRAEAEAASRDAIIFSLAKLAESRDNETGQHLERICRYVEIIARALAGDHDVDEHWIRTITNTAALHDIGKVGVPDAVLRKPGRLTEDEHRIIQKHTTIGGDTLFAIKQHYGDDTFLRTATEIAFAHHERWDGTGYPFGLSGEDIALSARIVSVADVYDALTSKRVYKPGMSHEEASRIIVEGAGTQFDPVIVEVFKRVAEQLRVAADELRDR